MNLIAYATAGNQWVAGLGDPTPMGWLTVFAYFVTAILCLAAAAKPLFSSRENNARSDLRFWLVLAGILFLLGLNKQLDFQSLLTAIGRTVTTRTGTYDSRHLFQLILIVAVAVLSAWLTIRFLQRFRGSARRNRLALVGLVVLVVFVAMRATSFHYLDALIDAEILGLRVNWIFELAGIGLIAAAALLHLRRWSRQNRWQRRLAPRDRSA